ncbi:MAG: TipAS antibiotic-recognition domain-containing protein, partial [Parvularculaceae bacterium]
LTTVDGDDRPNFARLVAARREALEAERDALDRSIALLCASERDLATAGAVSADALCRIIEMGERAVAAEQWKKIYDRYYTDDEQEEWRAAKERAFADVDLDAYERRWTDLAARIEAALPLDPGSEQAQSLLKEWNELLSVFMDGASPRMQENAGRLWANFDDWKDDVDQPISPRVWAFVKEASSRAAG